MPGTVDEGKPAPRASHPPQAPREENPASASMAQRVAPVPSAKAAEVARLEALNAELLQENELLLAQLIEIQDELERHSLESQGARARAAASTRRAAAASGHEVDLLGEISGENWYGAEVDGRWAGPHETSSLRIPALGEGEYRLELVIVEAIAPDILQGLEVWLNGRRIEVTWESNTAPTVAHARVASEGASTGDRWEFRFKFPRTVSPADRGSTDNRRLAVKLRSMRLTRAGQDMGEAAARAEEDARRLAFESRFWHEHQPAEVRIDLRREIDGANWFAAEPEGRWAGPERESTLRFPALRRGRYEVALDIPATMDSAILAEMALALNGVALEMKADAKGVPATLRASFSTADIPTAPVWELRFRFPRLVAPATRGSDDPRTLAVHVRTVTLRDLDATPRTDDQLLSRLKASQDELRRLRFAQASELEVDLRGDIEGENFSAPDADGRWTGPAETSILRVPAMQDGLYEVQLRVLEALEPSVLTGLGLRVNGMPLEISVGAATCPTLIVARFSTDEIPGSSWWAFALQLPARRAVADGAGDALRRLGLKLGSLKVFALGAGAHATPPPRSLEATA